MYNMLVNNYEKNSYHDNDIWDIMLIRTTALTTIIVIMKPWQYSYDLMTIIKYDAAQDVFAKL